MLNKALINKWTWSFAMEREAIWKRVIVGNLGKRQGDEGHARERIGMEWACRRQVEKDRMLLKVGLVT